MLSPDWLGPFTQNGDGDRSEEAEEAAAVWNVQSVTVRKWCRRFGFNAPWRLLCFCHRQKKPRATSTSPTSWSTEPSSARKNSELTFGISRVNVFTDSVGRRVRFECMLIFFFFRFHLSLCSAFKACHLHVMMFYFAAESHEDMNL